MYEFFRISYGKIKHRLSTFFTRRRLAFCFALAFTVFGFIQTPLVRYASNYERNYRGYIDPVVGAHGSFFLNNDSQTATVVGNSSSFTLSLSSSSFRSFSVPPSAIVDVVCTLGYPYPTPIFAFTNCQNPDDPYPSLYVNITLQNDSIYSLSNVIVQTSFYDYTNNLIGSLYATWSTISASGGSKSIQYDTLYQSQNGGLKFTSNFFGYVRIRFLFSTPSAVISSAQLRDFYSGLTAGVSFMYSYPLSKDIISGNVTATIPGNSSTQATVNQFTQADNILNSDFNEYQAVEGKYTDDFKRAEAAISESFTGWSWGSLRPAALWVGQQLTNVYNLSGDFRQYLVYPLLLGVALVFLGRWGSVRSSKRRHDMRQNKSGGGDSG